MKRSAVLCLMVAFFAGFVFSQTVNICGTVKDQDGNPLTHTVVRLSVKTYDNGYWATAPYLVTTNDSGKYQLGSGPCPPVEVIDGIKAARGGAFLQPKFVGGKVFFSVPDAKALVRMELFDFAGRFVKEAMNSQQTRGMYSVSINTRGLSSQFYLLRVSIGGVSSVFTFQPLSRAQGATAVQYLSDLRSGMEKTAAVVDTVRATEPGYTIGVTPIDTLVKHVDFVLTKNHTYNGDENAFWGDTSKFPRNSGGVIYKVLNRTNGAFPDSKIYWSNQMNGTKIPITQQDTFRVGGGGRFYIWVAPTDSNNRYFDFLEQNLCGPQGWCGNTTRVDGFRLPITFRVHRTTAGLRDTIMGDAIWLFYQSRQSMFEEYTNETPKEFQHLSKVNFANIYAPHMTAQNYFNTNGVYVNYFDKYEDSVIAHNPGAPGKVNAWNVFACAGGGMGQSPDYSAALNRHIGTRPQGSNMINWRVLDSAYYYKDAPCNYFSKWCHRRSYNNFCYGFPYDDVGGHAAFMDPANVQWIAVAIGW